MHFMYNAYLRYSGAVEHPDDCHPMCQSTEDELPPAPWPEGYWPYYLDSGWELVEIHPS